MQKLQYSQIVKAFGHVGRTKMTLKQILKTMTVEEGGSELTFPVSYKV